MMDNDTRVALEDDLRAAILPILARQPADMTDQDFAALLAALTAAIVNKVAADHAL